MNATVALPHGSMPMIGLGTYLLADDQAQSAVAEALKLGYRRIDTAEFYANHVGIAAGIEASRVPRSELFITDKLAPSDGADWVPKKYDDAIAACKSCLSKLNTTYVDLYLLHHAFPKDERINQWRALVQLQKDGLVRDIGVSNWAEKHIDEIKAAGLPLPAVNQIELHPLCTQDALVAYCRANGIVVEAYSSLAPASTWRVDPGQSSAKSNDDQSAESPYTSTIRSILAKFEDKSITESQILLKWALQHGYPIIPKSSKRERLAQNMDLFGFEISAEDMAALDALNQNTPFAWPTGNPLLCE